MDSDQACIVSTFTDSLVPNLLFYNIVFILHMCMFTLPPLDAFPAFLWDHRWMELGLSALESIST